MKLSSLSAFLVSVFSCSMLSATFAFAACVIPGIVLWTLLGEAVSCCSVWLRLASLHFSLM